VLFGVESHLGFLLWLKVFFLQKAFYHASGGGLNEYQTHGGDAQSAPLTRAVRRTPGGLKMSSGQICSHCGRENREQAQFCGHCGQLLGREKSKRQNLGQKLADLWLRAAMVRNHKKARAKDTVQQLAMLKAKHYDAFISYSHAADGKLAPSLQRALQQLAKPWYKLRTLHVFRDETDLSAAPEGWPNIEAALNTSDYFLLLASRESARSKWVKREVEQWIGAGREDKLLIVLTDGEIVWDDRRKDFD
jgi:hypothetical protein